MDKNKLKLWFLQGVLALLIIIWPAAMTLLQFFWLVPLLMLAVDSPLPQLLTGTGALLAVMALTAWLTGNLDWANLFYLAGFFGLTLFTGQMVRSRQWGWARMAGALALLFFLWDLISIIWSWKIWQAQLAFLYKELSREVHQITELVARMYGQPATAMLTEETKKMLYWSVILLPGQQLTFTLLSAWTSAYFAGKQLGARENRLLPVPVRYWNLPWYLIWLAILGLMLLLLGPRAEGINILGANSLWLGACLGLLNGWGLVSLTLPYWNPLLRLLFILSLFFVGVIYLPLFALIGLLDLGFGWRQKLLTGGKS
ncbi:MULTISPECIES: DUF2232 domain-containing protein [Carboxydocella]|uniref:Predicted membrane protein n=2 Tax=Carboxydocella TaxID=178898 RepID=A0A1T4SC02_9FIRM|nr:MULTISPECIES: DUF2232 domain-containing protein [Carboxydocella]AVX21864.1 putative membrane protein (DUF2232) [Carboxydocella thermautotrophica]AVX32268.1 putative membrane protein (DUF2232) [Carboxydocella thermautotrophica]SKA25774.1 Predicted membrane protein [Carboxydocella sporoproducens DSM 16521]GAW27527.1 hypothetical protein ULO1_00970 [Carboxydocella sp. ULO1]GAW32561.1 hypothetical protein JDF658_23260 [Carboxydocella sp. JDF658]